MSIQRIQRFAVRSFWRSPHGPARMATPLRWRGDGGGRQLLVVGMPLVLSSLAGAINMFFDRLFLSWYDRNLHMTAALMAGMAWWFSIQVFHGVVAYTATFVAQFDGARKRSMIGPAVWQAIHIALFGGLVFWAAMPLWPKVFHDLAGHDPALAALEAAYCRHLTPSVVLLLLMVAMSCFFSGRGRTLLVMAISGIAALINIALNRWFIFNPPEWLPFIEPGIVGAAWGTNFAHAAAVLMYLPFFLRPRYRAQYRTWGRSMLPDMALLVRLLRFGFPQSVHFLVDMAALTVFALVIGRLDPVAATATSIVFNINLLTFLGVIGLSAAISVLVGRFHAAGRDRRAERTTFTGLVVVVAYMAVWSAAYLLLPDLLIGLHAAEGETVEDMGRVAELARLFLVLAAVFNMTDALALTYSGAIKGAGDTQFFMWMSAANGLLLIGIPSALTLAFGWSAIVLWVFFTLFIMCFGVLNTLRYRSGAWKGVRMVD